jgi:hypothetical protein
VVLDWDDTLFPTSNLNPVDETSYDRLYDANWESLEAIEDLAITLIERCRSIAHVVIVTNAKRGWVEFSSSVFMPKLHEILMKHIKIISARDNYEEKHPYDSFKWKEMAFLDLWEDSDLQLDKAAITNFIAMGDADYEMDAARVFCSKSDRCLLKLIKLGESPRYEELRKELQCVVDRFDYIH